MATQKRQRNLLAVVAEQQVAVVVVVAGVGHQMLQTLAGLVEQAVVLLFQTGQKHSERELLVGLQMH